MLARVQDNGEISQPFPVSNGVKQGCVLAPTLISILFSAMLTDAFRDTDVGIGINHRTDCSVSNLRRLQSKPRSYQTPPMTSCLPTTVPLMLLQKLTCNTALTSLLRPATTSEFTISIKKTKVMHQPAPGKAYPGPSMWTNSPTLSAHSRET